MDRLNAQYWQQRYENLATGWDIGHVSTPLKAYFDQLTNKKLKILVPGAGNAHEAQYLHERGFEQVFVLDWAYSALQNFKERVPSFPNEHLINANFFDYNPSVLYDLIIEQTFFCALPPNLRLPYVHKVHQLLKPQAKLVGLLFDFPLTEDGPPYGGHINDYQVLFVIHFNIRIMDNCYNSIPPRMGKELFIKLEKR